MKKIVYIIFYFCCFNHIFAQHTTPKKLNRDIILDSIQQVHKILSEEHFILNIFDTDFDKGTEFTTIEGKKIKLSDFKDKPIAIKFWASWCKPCHLLSERDKEEGYSDEAIYIYIIEQDQKEKALAFIKKNKDKYFSAKNTYHIFDGDNPDFVQERKDSKSIFMGNSYPHYYWITKDSWFIHSPKYMIGYQQDKIIVEKLLRLKKFIF